mgnify:CR=1 FL=1
MVLQGYWRRSCSAAPEQQAQQQTETCDDAQGLPRILLNIGFAGLAHGITALAYRLAALGEGAARTLQVELNLLAQLNGLVTFEQLQKPE